MAEHVAIQQAVERRRREQREEEELAGYSREELEQDWEFKILRSSSGAFRNPQSLIKALNEEALAGWVLLEKFDNQRIRLKRPVSARQNDGQLPVSYDPYRTQYGINTNWVAAVIVGLIILAGVLVGILSSGI